MATVPPRRHQPDPGDRPQWTAARPGARSSSRGQRDTHGALPRHPHAVWPLDLQTARIANHGLPVMMWEYWYDDNSNGWCAFWVGGSPDGTQAVEQWQADETQNGGGAN